MSQPPMQPYGYPPPPGYAPPGYAPQYAFWPYYDAAPDALLAPARRAGWVLIGLGVAAVLFGTCFGVFAAQMSEADLAPIVEQLRAQPAIRDGQVAVTSQVVRALYVAMFGATGVAGVVGIALGALVRTGHRAWLVIGIVACAGLSLLWLLVLASGLGAGPAAAAGAVVMLALPIAATVAAFRFLLQAMHHASQIDAARHRAAYASHYGASPPQ